MRRTCFRGINARCLEGLRSFSLPGPLPSQGLRWLRQQVGQFREASIQPILLFPNHATISQRKSWTSVLQLCKSGTAKIE